MFLDMNKFLHLNKMVKEKNTTWICLILCGLNILVMHLWYLYSLIIGDEIDITIIIDNILGILIDVMVLFLLFYLLSGKRLKTGLTITFFITLFWSFSNALYSRFFHHYISLSAIGQAGTLFDSEMIRCVLDGIRWVDLYFVLNTILFFILIKKTRPSRNIISKGVVCLIIMVCIDLFSYFIYCSLRPEYRYISYFIHRIEHRQFSLQMHLFDPSNAVFRRGCIRSLLYEFVLNLNSTIQLSSEQERQIANEMKMLDHHSNDSCFIMADKNLIFILVESYMSFTSDMKVNGKEVTPFLNSLKCDSTVYFNGNMHENVTIGESSDGQFIYMTGLLPLRSVITVSVARHVSLPALPKMIEKNSRMVIPTVNSMWNQDEMCHQYGFSNLYASNDYAEGQFKHLNDEQVIQLAMQIDKNWKQPFFSVILTMSMHQPYTQQIDSTFLISDPSIRNDLACYLNACHYTDQQLKVYFQHLKDAGVYDKSLIVIAADHSVHNTDFGKNNDKIPIYLVNIPYEIKKKMWQGDCNQLDLYTTLLDIMGIDSYWYGLGRSLLSTDYQNNIDDNKWILSEWIIRGDYFSNHK